MAVEGQPDPRRRGAGRGSANVEIKARCHDLGRVRERARRLGARRVGVDRQVDTYFRTRRGRLKLRESSLSGGQLVPYLRPDRSGPARSDYRVVPVDDPAGLKSLLADLLGVHRVVSKRREIWLWHEVRIHLDEVDGLGSFVELEAVFDGSEPGEQSGRRDVDRLLGELGIDAGELVAQSYEQLSRP